MNASKDWSTSGSHLIVSVPNSPNPPFVFGRFLDNPNNCTLPGIFIDLFKWIANEMKFTYHFVFPSNGTYGSLLSNGDWDGTVGQVYHSEADVSGTPLFMTEQRSRYIEYGPSIPDVILSQYGLLFKIHKEQYMQHLSEVQTFDLWSWIAVGVVLIILSVLLFMHDVVLKHIPWKYFVWFLASLREAEEEAYSSTKPQMRLLAAFPLALGCFGSLAVFAKHFDAMLISHLSSSIPIYPVNSLDDATAFIYQRKLTLVTLKSETEEFLGLFDAFQSMSAELAEFTNAFKLNQNRTYFAAENSSQLLEILDANAFAAYFGNYLQIKSTVGNLNGYRFVSAYTSLMPTSAYIYRRDWEHAEDFRIVTAAISDIVMLKLCKNYFENCVEDESSISNDAAVLPLSRFRNEFYLIFVVYGTAMAVLALERMVHNFHPLKNMQTTKTNVKKLVLRAKN